VPDAASPPGAVPRVRSVVPDLFRVVRRLRRMSEPSTVDLAALLLLHRLGCGGPLRPSDLAGEVGLDVSTVSRHVRSLEEATLVSRQPDPADGRSFLLSVTERGAMVMAESLARREQALDRVLATWPEAEAADLRRLLARLADDLDQLDEETP
jgi:DNA-binding MarR family transcriptional regulator